MTSVYDNDNKLYPNLDGKSYRLEKINQIEKFFLDEISEREKLAKKCGRVVKAIYAVDTSLIVTTVLTGSTSIAAFATGIGLPVGLVLSGTSLALSLGSGITRKSCNSFIIKQKKHEEIRLLAETKLDSIQNLISKALKDATISDIEFDQVLKELERYRLLKQEIRQKSKKKIDTISNKQREAILAQGRKEGEDAFLDKIVKSSGIPTAPAM